MNARTLLDTVLSKVAIDFDLMVPGAQIDGEDDPENDWLIMDAEGTVVAQVPRTLPVEWVQFVVMACNAAAAAGGEEP